MITTGHKGWKDDFGSRSIDWLFCIGTTWTIDLHPTSNTARLITALYANTLLLKYQF